MALSNGGFIPNYGNKSHYGDDGHESIFDRMYTNYRQRAQDNAGSAFERERQRMKFEKERAKQNEGKVTMIDDGKEAPEGVAMNHVIMSLRMALSNYKHDLQKVKEGFEQQYIPPARYHTLMTNIEQKIKEYEFAIYVLTDNNEDYNDD